MNRLLVSLIFLCTCIATSHAQQKMPGLPTGAVTLETRRLDLAGHADRALVLWMLKPKKNPDGYTAKDLYTCPDYSRGSHYSGPARVSLIDLKSNSIINTVEIPGSGGEDSIDLPYAIRRGYHYRVTAVVKKGVEAKPNIIWLRDYNGDGKALEFALFNAPACMGLETALIGYSEKQDRVIMYPYLLRETEGTKESQRTAYWVEYLFATKPTSPGHWKYEIDYRGRGGALVQWELRYNKAAEQFEGTSKSIADNSQ